MRRQLKSRSAIVMLLVASAGIVPVAVSAAGQPLQLQAESSRPVLVRVQFTVERLEGDTVTSSLPLEVLVRANAPNATASLNHGMDVAVPQMTKDGTTSYTYRRVGTNASVRDALFTDGIVSFVFSLELSSVEPAPVVAPVANAPFFRSFQVTEFVSLRPAESLSAALGTDKMTGETVRLSVKADVVR